MSYGRRVIYSDATEITAENVADEVRKAYLVHGTNQTEIQKLHEVYRGKTDILSKVKEVRPSINHKINENRAYEIVNFYNGYVFGEPVQYVRRENTQRNEADDSVASDINALNAYMCSAGKATCDKNLGEWMFIAGVGYRLTLPNKQWLKDGDEAPFTVRALRPEQTFMICSSDVDEHELAAVHVAVRQDNEKVFSVYTDKYLFKFTEFGTVEATPHTLGMIPIVEYPLEASRLGVFEVVLDQLNALNELQSNRMDDIVQFVNSFLAVLGAELDEETYKKLEEWKTLCLPEGSDAKYIAANLSQADVQTLKNDILEAIITITGIPNRNGGTSTSDTGSAVIMRDGWQAAEARAKSVETMFKAAEAKTLKLVLRILRDTIGTGLKLADIDTRFTRRNYENIASKSQVLVAMLNNPKIHPELAFQSCGMFPDPESAYLQSKEYYEEQMEKWEAVEVDESDGDEDVRVS